MPKLPVLPIYRPAQPAAAPASACQHGCGCGHAAPAGPAIDAAVPGALADGLQRSVVQIAQMDCPVEVQLIEHALGKRPEVAALSFNLLKRQLTVDHQPGSQTGWLEAIRALGFTPLLMQAGDVAPVERPTPWWPLAASGLAALGAELAHAWAGQWPWPSAVSSCHCPPISVTKRATMVSPRPLPSARCCAPR